MGHEYDLGGRPDILAQATKGAMITPNDTTDLGTTAKAIVVTSTAGGTDLQILPFGNADGDWISFAGVPVGFVPPFMVRRVGVATTCVVAAALD